MAQFSSSYKFSHKFRKNERILRKFMIELVKNLRKNDDKKAA